MKKLSGFLNAGSKQLLWVALATLSACGHDNSENESEEQVDLESSNEALVTNYYTPTDDTFLSQAAPTTNYASTGYLSVAGETAARVTYLQFTITAPMGKVAASAELTLTGGGYSTAGSSVGGTIRKFNPSTLWNESGAWTWSKPIPGSDGSGDLSSIGAVASGGKYKFTNLKSTLPKGGATSSTSARVTYVIRSTSTDDVGFYSSEAADTTLRPQLKVVWGAAADLSVTSLTAIATESSVTVRYSVKNTGEFATPSVPIRFYAANSYATASTNLLCSDTVPALAANALYPTSGTRQVVCTIPAGVVGPAVTAWLDPSNAVAELNESNNKKEVAVTVGPDLIPAGLATWVNGSGQVTFSSPGVTNRGTKTAGASRFGIYLRNSSGVSRVLCDKAISSLAPGASTGRLTLVCSTSGWAAGSYLPISIADHTNLVKEAIESNSSYRDDGSSATRVTIGAGAVDLYVSSFKVAAASGNWTISYTVKNAGTATAAATRTRFQLAKAWYFPPLTATDLILANVNIPSLAAGASSSGSFVVKIPAWAPGWYPLYATADVDKVVAETDENNLTMFLYYGPGTANVGVPIGQ